MSEQQQKLALDKVQNRCNYGYSERVGNVVRKYLLQLSVSLCAAPGSDSKESLVPEYMVKTRALYSEPDCLAIKSDNRRRYVQRCWPLRS